MALQLFKPDNRLASKLGVVTADQKPVEQVLHDARNWFELRGITLDAVDGTCVMTVKPVEDARITECMLTLRHLT